MVELRRDAAIVCQFRWIIGGAAATAAAAAAALCLLLLIVHSFVARECVDMAIQSLFILNKSGGLIYQKDVSRRLPAEEGGRETTKKRMGMNEKMMAGSTFHGLSQIAASVSPEVGAFGIVRIVTETYVLQCFESLTGLFFFSSRSATN